MGILSLCRNLNEVVESPSWEVLLSDGHVPRRREAIQERYQGGRHRLLFLLIPTFLLIPFNAIYLGNVLYVHQRI